MKKRFLYAAIFWAGIASTLPAQKVSVNAKQTKLENVFNTISKQTGYTFAYSTSIINPEIRVTIHSENENLKDVLQKLFKDEDINFEIKDKKVYLKAKESTTPVKTGKNKTIKGNVTDQTGEAVIGANVVVPGTTIGTITDFDGNFILDVPEDAKLKFSYIGLLDQLVDVKGKNQFNIQMKDNSKALEEVVVVGYGTQKKVNLTGAVESIDQKSIKDRPIRSASDALQGSVSGLTVTSASGKPGEFASFKIRGNTSVNSGGALVLIDGMPSSMDMINPQDIKTISVLKDAASAAIYGARAAEGVILITTKTADSEKIQINYSGNISFNKPTRIPDSNNALDHMLLSNLAFKNAGLAEQFSDKAIEAVKDKSIVSIPTGNDFIYTDDVDWISLMMDNSFQQTHNLNISKSSDGLTYLFSAGWLEQNGLFAEYGPDNYDRINLRSNISADIIKDKFIFDSKVNFTSSTSKYHPQFSSWSIPYITFIQAGPNMPIYDENGNYARYRMQLNPIQALREGGEGRNTQQRIEGVFTLSYKVNNSLKFKAVGGAKLINNRLKEFRKEYGKYGPNGLISMSAGQSGSSQVKQSSYYTDYYTGQLIGEYNKKFKKNEFDLLAGWSWELNKYDRLNAARNNIIGNELPSMNLGDTEGWSNSVDGSEWALMSGFMRVNYAFDSKYLLEANFRADASSRFSSKHRWGVFPSVSAAWRITEEKFMADQKLFSNLKLRGSWGQLGNQSGLGAYDHIPQYSVSGFYPFLNELGQWANAASLPSLNRTWETVDMKNIALEAGFLNNRLNVIGEYFHKTNHDMLVAVEVPSVIGINLPTGNFGELKVKGWEMSIEWRDKIKSFSYSAKFNISDQKDKLVKFNAAHSGLIAGINQKIEGYPLGSIFGYDTDGFFTSEDEVKNSAVINKAVVGVGDIKYLDKNNDGKISAPHDLVYLGNTSPRYVFGLNLSGQWKGWDVSMLFQGVGKRDFYLNSEVVAPFANTWGNYSYKMHNDYWTPDNTDAFLPRHYAGSGHNYQTSKHWIQNASYLRAKNVQISYSLNKLISQKIGLSNIRLYFSGENLFEFSNLHKDYDPELNNVAGYMYPIMRSYSFGLNLTL